MENDLKKMVNPEVYSRVNSALEIYRKADLTKTLMDNCTKAIAQIKRTPNARWHLRFSMSGSTVIELTTEDDKDPHIELTLETLKQFFLLLETLYYNELKGLTEQFDKSLTKKIEEDGKAAGK